MSVWLEKAGKGFILAFLASLLTYMPGIWEAPNLADARALGVAALGASIAAGLLVIKAFLSEFSWGTLLTPLGVPLAWVSRIDLFSVTFVGTLIVSTTDLINQAPDLGTWRALVTAAITGAIAAAFRAVVALGTKGESPAPAKGV